MHERVRAASRLWPGQLQQQDPSGALGNQIELNGAGVPASSSFSPPAQEISGWYYLLGEDLGRTKHLKVAVRRLKQSRGASPTGTWGWALALGVRAGSWGAFSPALVSLTCCQGWTEQGEGASPVPQVQTPWGFRSGLPWPRGVPLAHKDLIYGVWMWHGGRGAVRSCVLLG